MAEEGRLASAPVRLQGFTEREPERRAHIGEGRLGPGAAQDRQPSAQAVPAAVHRRHLRWQHCCAEVDTAPPKRAPCHWAPPAHRQTAPCQAPLLSGNATACRPPTSLGLHGRC